MVSDDEIDVANRVLPPIGEVCMLTMALVVVAGVFMVAHLPKEVPLVPPILLVGAASSSLLWCILTLTQLKDFAWDSFFLVAKWSLVAYAVISGMLEFVFIHNHTPGDVLAVLTASLAIFAVNVPLLFGFSVARYQQPQRAS